jgi:glucose 1-dehydrogenase
MVNNYLTGKILFITGSSRGIGKATALRAAKLGASVVLHCCTSRESAEQVAGDIRSFGGKAAVVQGDLGSTEEITACAENAWNAFGRIDVLINNAGIPHKQLFIETKAEDLDRLYRVNVRGTYSLTCNVLRHMKSFQKDLNGPRILTITSINGVRSGVGFSLYGGSKAFLEMMMKDLALECAPLGILVNTFPIGSVKTDMTEFAWSDPNLSKEVNSGIPLGRMGSPDEIADLLCAFAGPAGNYVTGASIIADGGLALTRSIGLLKATE